MRLVIDNKRLMLRRKLNVPWEAYQYLGLDHLYLIPYWMIMTIIYWLLGVHWHGVEEKKLYWLWYKKLRDPDYGMIWRELK